MRIFGILGLAVLVTAGPAIAFEETVIQGSGPKATVSDTPGIVIEPQSHPATQGLELSVPDVTGGGDKGTAVQIPGLGTIGVLPKLDFGLELLYGANASSNGDVPLEMNAPEAQPDNLTVRGAIKNTF